MTTHGQAGGPDSEAIQRSGLVLAAQPVRALWGFSWRGWLALAVLATLALSAWLGWDPNIQMYKVWAWLFGGESLGWFAVYVCVYPRFAMLKPQLTLITALVAVIALWLQPGRYPWGRMLVLWVAAGLMAQLPWVSIRWLSWLVNWANITAGGLAYSLITDLLAVVVSAALLGWALRSWLVAVVTLIAGAVAVVLLSFQFLGTFGPLLPILPFVEVGMVWQIVVGGTMLGVAARRRSAIPSGEGPWCARCLYPIPNRKATVCSECGAALQTTASK